MKLLTLKMSLLLYPLLGRSAYVSPLALSRCPDVFSQEKESAFLAQLQKRENEEYDRAVMESEKERDLAKVFLSFFFYIYFLTQFLASPRLV